MLNFTHGVYQWLTSQVVGTLTDVTIDFIPKAIRFYWVGIQSNIIADASSQAVSERRGVGFVVSTDSQSVFRLNVIEACVGTFSADGAASADCGSVWSNSSCVITVNGTGTVNGALEVTGVNIERGFYGFTIRVGIQAPANISVFWEAWGGDEITNTTIGTIEEPAATGQQTYTAAGFVPNGVNSNMRDQCVMFAGVQTVNASTTGQAQDSGLHVGFATSNPVDGASQITVCGNSDDASATMDTDGYNYTGQCLSMITIAGGNPNATAGLAFLQTGSFTLTWTNRATTNRRSIYMAIKGGEWQAGSVTIAGNTANSTATIQGLPFNIRGVSLIGAMKTQSTINTSTVNDRIGFGSGLSPDSRNSVAVLDEDATANAEIDTSIYYNQVLVYPSVTGTLQTAYDINNLSANSLTLITDTAGGVANEWIGYLVFGDRKPRTSSVGHPFIC